jgi:hypothetical protein
MSGASEHSDYESNDYTHIVSIGIRAMDMRANQAGGITALVHNYAQELIHAFPKGLDDIGSMAYSFAAQHRHVDDAASTRLASHAFLKGAITGLLVARESYDTLLNINDVLSVIDPKQVATNGDHLSHLNAIVIALQERTRAALAVLPDDDEAILEKWEAACIETIDFHSLYRSGFRLLLGSANWVVEQQYAVDLMQMEIEPDGSVSGDWDAALTALLDNDQ